MTRLFLTFLFAVLLISPPSWSYDQNSRWSIEAETGIAFQGRNDVSIPGDTGTEVDLTELQEKGTIYGRLHLDYFITPRHQIRAIYAPLQFDGGGVLSQDVMFNGTQFDQGDRVQTAFQFNSYRLGYRYWFGQNSNWKFRIGATAKIRDAFVSIKTTSLSEKYDNIGIVPLLHVGLRGYFCPQVGLDIDIDGAWAPQGRAEDIAVKIFFRPSKHWEGAVGYRVLEGGADNDKVFTFAWVNYYVLSLKYIF